MTASSERADRLRDLLVTARKDIDVVVALGRASQHHAVGMEGRRGDGRAFRLVEEAIVRLNARKLETVEVEDLDRVVGGAAGAKWLAYVFR